MPNPFFFGGRIEESAYFIGRETELRRIFSALDRFSSGQAQHISIVGQRRIGKSSLLFHLTRSYQIYLSQPEKYRFVYIDTGDSRCHTLTGLLNLIVKEFQIIPMPSKMTLPRFAEILDEFKLKTGVCPVLCLDDFERLVIHESEFPIQMFDMWRSLGSSNKIAFVISSQRLLSEIMTTNNLISPFYNIFQIITVHEFNSQECQTLFNKSSEIDLPFSEEERNQLLKLAGSYPANLQIASSLLCSQKLNLKNTEKINWESLRRDYKQQVNYMQEVKTKSSFFALPKKGVSLILITFPTLTGRFVLDIIGRHNSKDSSALITGWVILLTILALLGGWLSFNTLVNIWNIVSHQK